MNGVLVVDKPSGPTSFDVVRQLRRALGGRAVKIGHGGTLDPLACGVLPVCLGEATKLAPFLLDADKEYEATLCFGVETDTLDAQGAVTARRPVSRLTEAAVLGALPAFTGTIGQTPPMYSALKRGGRPLYALARQGKEVERVPREITVHELSLVGFSGATAVLRVRCSKGTYIRALASDLGQALGVGAHLTALRRLRSGPFGIDRSASLEALVAAAWNREPLPLVGLADALGHLPALRVDDGVALAVAQGRPVACRTVGLTSGSAVPIRLLLADGTLLAVADPRSDDVLRTLRVFHRSPRGPPRH